jgi:hypothetical protein
MNYFKLNDEFAYEYRTYKSTDTSALEIYKSADLLVPEYLELEFSNPSRNNLSDIKNLFLIIKVDDQIICQFPLSLLVNLQEPIITDEKMYINLQPNMFFEKLNLVGLYYSKIISFSFESNPSIKYILTYGIVCVLSYVDKTSREKLVKPTENLIQQIKTIEFVTTNPSPSLYILNLSKINTGPTKGFFIECADIDNLKCLTLVLNGANRFELDKFLIKTKCKKISQYMIYFPFNYINEYSDLSIESYCGLINFSGVGSIILTLEFNTGIEIDKIKVHILSLNVYRQISGIGGLAYSVGFCNETKILKNLL